MKNLAVFYGGKSAEHDISIITAIQVMNNLDKEKYNIVPIYIDYDNSWHILDNYKDMHIYTNNDKKGKSLATGFFDKYLLSKSTFGLKKYKRIDVAINCCHGLNGEDGTLAGLLTLANIPFVGSNALASSVGMDKVIMKDVFRANNIPCPKYMYFLQEDYQKNSNEIILKAEIEISYPMIVKPSRLGSSIGINISKNREELQKNIEIALNFDKKVIIEQVIPNLREINCSCIKVENDLKTSLLEEPKNWKTFLTFDEKYLQPNIDNNKKTIGISLGKELDNQIFDITKMIYQILGCSGVVRIDYLLDNETKQIYTNEINTIPGSYANYLWKDKYTFTQLLDELIASCEKEYLCINGYNYAYKSNALQNFQGSKNLPKIIK